MSLPIEDYALLGDTRAAALVGRNGSIDWLCFPRFDSPACFAALLGSPEHGRWLLAPSQPSASVHRAYRPGTLVLDTDYETEGGAVRVTDCMPVVDDRSDVVRVVTGLRGRVHMQLEIVVRFDYGSVVPWARREGRTLSFKAGPDALHLHAGGGVRLEPRGFRTVADFEVEAGQIVPFTLCHHLSHEPAPFPLDASAAVDATQEWWRSWASGCRYEGPWRDAVLHSLVTIKALTHSPTGGIVAAPTSSLPEQLGGSRNWDYRYCWIRDAAFSLYALLIGGFTDEARAWRGWLLRAAAGHPSDLQVLYGVAGERRLPEYEIDWLPGYEGSAPVRVGNAAVDQLQLDVYGELIDAMHAARSAGLEPETRAWAVECALLADLAKHWDEPDDGIWEMRGGRQHFTHSKVMAWVAFDRAVKAVERFGLKGSVERWRALRDEIHARVCRDGFHPGRGTFVQAFGSERLDASLLLMPLVGFLPADDPRMKATVEAIERELTIDGLVRRYASDADGLSGDEGVFLPCSFWLADNLALQGRAREARALFERLLGLRNDVGLLSEEYDPRSGRLLGNFPQAFTHVMLVNAACNLTRAGAHHRARSSIEAAVSEPPPAPEHDAPRVLAIDVGGSHVKMLVSTEDEPRRIESGPEMTAAQMVAGVLEACSDWEYDVVAMGYPGPVHDGRPVLDPRNLGSGWVGFDYESAFGRPVRIANDAAMQALGSDQGGRMLFLGLGTGLGSALVIDGSVEAMELAHMHYKKGRSFEDYLGRRGLDRLGKKHWREEVAKVVELLRQAVQADYVVLGGGNAKKLEELPPHARLGDNRNAFVGGFRMWRDSADPREPDQRGGASSAGAGSA